MARWVPRWLLLLSENVHPWVVMELLGHSQMRTTMDIYSHVMPALAREAADRMGTVLLMTRASTATETTQAALPKENGLVTRVELRGLEPLTPTLPGRLAGIRGGPSRFLPAGQRAGKSFRDNSERPGTTRCGHHLGTTRRPPTPAR
jgi:hypothetical protein